MVPDDDGDAVKRDVPIDPADTDPRQRTQHVCEECGGAIHVDSYVVTIDHALATPFGLTSSAEGCPTLRYHRDCYDDGSDGVDA